MCGIVAVVRRPAERTPPTAGSVVSFLHQAREAAEDSGASIAARLDRVAAHLASADRLLRGTPGLVALIETPALVNEIATCSAEIEAELNAIDRRLYDAPDDYSVEDVELISSALIAARDRLWAVAKDRLDHAEAVSHLAGGYRHRAAIDAYASIQTALASLDRLEVRGRDSAGLHILVWGHELDLQSSAVASAIGRRRDPNFESGAVRVDAGRLGFVYKAAAEIGELGDNVAALRRAIAGDELLRDALGSQTAQVTVVGHTRWASVGTISQPNAHPLDGLEEDSTEQLPHLIGVLNGDIDNFSNLVVRQELLLPSVITTDAKAIPVLTSRRISEGEDFATAFGNTVGELQGSMAIVANSAREPARLGLAVRGSGQGLYVGLAEDTFVVASEPYGVIEETSQYLRVDGDATSGRLVFLDGARAGSLEGIDRRGYDQRPLKVQEADLETAEITTRDIDRKGFPHFLLKEITESPASFRKTLRGRILNLDGTFKVALGTRALPEGLTSRLVDKSIRRVIVIGQGTAAVAAQAASAAIRQALRPLGTSVMSMPSTELSGFALDDDMQDTLVVAISQSGTTTDTNRTVDMAKARGAVVLAIVNRRNTDLVAKAHGVVYTSDGRDVEMSVASTKAFYAQVAAGFLLSLALADGAGVADPKAESELLEALQTLPDAMRTVLERRELVAGIARRHAPRRRHWAVVGSGPDRVAAAEVRIKLSELCYKSVASDFTEDKKHIDLSSEPLIFVCGAGLEGANAEDAGKEIAIYRAHKAAPVVVAAEGSQFEGADVIPVPKVHPRLAFVLSAMAGHLFGYEAALAIDEQARPLRQIRAAIQELAGEGLSAGNILLQLPDLIDAPSRQFLEIATHGALDGVMNLGPAMRLALLLRCATGELPFDAYELEHGAGADPKSFLDDLVSVLTQAVDDLTRSIDAVKHQAKTVTVGISRSEPVFNVPLVKETMRVGPRIEELGYRALRSLAALDPAIAEVQGFTRYVVTGDVRSLSATIHVVDRGGIAEGMRSRTEFDSRLRGTKRVVLEKAEVEVTIGRSDGRAVVLVPERKGDVTQGLTLLHVKFRDRLDAAAAREALTGYKLARYEALVAAVTETEDFREEVLGELSMPELLVEPVLSVAERWRSREAT